MRGSVRQLVAVCGVCCVVGLGLGGSSVPAFGEEGSSGGGFGASSPLVGPLVSPSSPVEGEQLHAQEEAQRSTPEAVAVREASRTKFENLNTEQAAKVAGEAFPDLIDHPSGGLPSLPAGQSVTGYLSDNVAQVDLGGGERGLIEAVQPIAIEGAEGRHLPVDLGLSESGAGFEPKTPVVGVSIPKRLSDGVQIPALSLSLTPVDAQGAVLGGSEGAVVGAGVFYANTQTDTDTVIKPTTAGFAADTLLRSVESPDELYFRVGLPEGASLVQGGGAGGGASSAGNGESSGGGTGPVEVMEEGAVIAMIDPPVAVDAAGASVPVSMSVDGDVLALSIASHTGEHQWPIEVDPEVETVVDKKIGPSECLKTGEAERESSEWCFQSNDEAHFKREWHSGFVELENSYPISPGEYADIQYETQGASRIYEIEALTRNIAYLGGRIKLQLTHNVTHGGGPEEGEVENTAVLAENSASEETRKLCPSSGESECSKSAAHESNLAWYRLEAAERVEYSNAIDGELLGANVYIAQERAPELSFNSSSSTIDEGRQNVMYGSGGWLSPTSGAVEMIAHDPGVGVSRAGGEDLTGGKYRFEEPIYKDGKCLGVQCKETYQTPFTYSPEMANGEDKFELWGEDTAGLFGYTDVTVKVDSTPPHSLEVTGWPSNREISAATHTITVHATDGTKPTVSSGVKSIEVSVDGGKQTAVAGASCSPGECTASGTYALQAEGLSEGVHRLTVTATDNAGNVAAEEFTFDVRHGSPVPVGPGVVDPTTGQFKLSASDVSMAGAGGVSRVYESRNLTAGVGGPLGPQWAISLGGGQGLTVLPTGSVVLTSPTGGATTFTRNSKGEFESPLGDGNLKVEAKEKEAGKGITEYLLEDFKAGTTTTFTQPAGTESTTPLFSDQFGTEGAQLNHPTALATDASGNVWVADYLNNRILKFSRSGTLLGAYGAYGTGLDQFIHPRGIAVNQSNGDVYVTDEGNNRVTELNEKGSFIATFGWGVSNGASELQTCESYCSAGTAGSGAGQFKEAKGLTVDSSGDVWVADYGNDRIQELSSTGKYLKELLSQGGGEGSGEGQFKGPIGIAFSGGNLYVAEYGNDRVQELSTADKYLGQFGKAGSGNGEFKEPAGITADPKSGDLYVADGGNDRIQEFTAAGKLIAKFGTAGSGTGQFSQPKGVAVGASGGVYVADYENSRVEEWTRPTWLPTLTEGALKSGTIAYAYKPVEEEGRTVIEPTEVLAPTPAGVTCVGESKELEVKALKDGCRALTFTYSEKTGATGENESEWGTYVGRLAKVSLIAYNPATKTMPETPVAEYSYDKQGRLRAEWDPRISPALKTTYGYDAEGHVTALTSPGQQPWVFTYGTIATDSGAGRLLSVTRPSSSTALGNGSPPVNTVAPTISGSLAIGTNASVSTGTWSNNPLSYAYQWELCNSSGSSCTPIVGATNATYFIDSGTIGHKLVVIVSATNKDGSQAVASSASAVIAKPAWFFYPFGEGGSGGGQFNDPAGEAVDSKGNLWVVDSGNDRIEEFTSSGAYVKSYGKEGSGEVQFNKPTGIAVNPTTGNLYITDSGNDRVEEITLEGKYVTSFGAKGEGHGQFNDPTGIAFLGVVQIYVVDTGNDRVEIFSASNNAYERQFGSKGSGREQFLNPEGISIFQEDGDCIYITDTGNDRVQKLWANLYGDDFEGSFGSKGSAAGEFLSPIGIETERYSGRIRVVDSGNDRIESFKGPELCDLASEEGAPTYEATFGSAGSGDYGQLKDPQWITEEPKGSLEGTLYVSDSQNKRIMQASEEALPELPAELPPPPNPGSNAVSTLEYHVPISGVGAPYPMSATEVAKWGQKDDPVEAMAVFPPDEAQSWPASSYKRATIRYMDEKGRTVNTAVPSGGIATSEYNETNDVTRALSADNRAAALKETGKTAEASEKLDTKSTYNSEGGELLETLGPEHEIKLAGGSEVKARDHVKYAYDQGAPSEYAGDGLVTETTDGAEYSGKEEDVHTTKTSYSGQSNLGWKLRKPTSVTTDPTGLNLTSTTKYEESTGNVLETQTPAASGKDALVPPAYSLAFGAKGSAGGQFEGPEHDAVDSHGDVWVADYANHRIQELSATGTFMLAVGWGVKDGKAEAETCTSSCKVGISGSGSGQFEGPYGIAVNQSSGNVYVADYLGDRVEELSSAGAFVASFGSKGTGGAQFSSPEGVALDSSGDVWVADSANNRIQELSASGTFMLAVGWGVKDGKAEAETCTSSCEVGIAGAGNGQLAGPTGIAFSGANAYVSDNGNDRVDEFSSAGAYVSKFGSKGSGTGQFEGTAAIAAEATGGDLYVVDSGNDRVQKLTASGTFVAAFGSKGSGNGQLLSPAGVAISSTGGVYVSDHSNDRVEEWVPAITGNAGAHEGKTIYYTAKGEAEVEACREHPEWANLPCETKPVAQPGTSGLPELPVTTVTYNMWDEVETTTEKFGSTTRTKTQTYDAAGRALTSEETSSPATDTALPKVTNEYNTETGALVKQSTTVGEKTKSISSVFNTLGQLTSYTDAAGATTTYEYEKEKDARLTKMSYAIEKEGFSQTYGYNATTGEMQELTDASTGTDPAAGRFTAIYDVEGKMLTAGYPNGMTEIYSYNSLGQAIGLEYVKQADCAKTCPETWFSDSVTPSIHGETLAQTSTLAKDSYAYDKAGRLTESQEIPTGKDCTTRLYSYDEESNRTSLTKRESSTETCATEGGSTEWHTYDTANRLTDAGIAYETFGNTTTLPAADAGGNALTSSYYVDGQVASQTQSEKTIDYHYDPAGRTEETETIVKGKPEATVVEHYAGPGEALTWASEGSEKWSRNIPGIDGALDAIQTNAGTPVLQLHDLQGNIVATVNDSEAETKLGSTYNSTEFGVPQPGTTVPKYAWLGAGGLATELSSGTATKGGASYVPQIARNLQTAAVVPPGAFPNGSGTGSENTAVIPGWSTALANAESAATLAEYTAEQEALRRKAEQEALETKERIAAEGAEMRRIVEEEHPAPTEGGAEEEEAIEEESGEPSASAARSHRRYGSYKYNMSQHGGGLFGSSLGSYEVWINAGWGGYAGGEITSQNIDCGWNPGVWQASDSSCTYRHTANNSQIVVKFYITFSFIRGLSSASRRIYCSMRIASEGYGRGGCSIVSEVGG